MSTGDTEFPFVAMSLLHAGAAFAPLLVLGRRRLADAEILLLAWVGLYLASLWASGASGWDRFTLPIVPALAVAALPGLSRLAAAGGSGVVLSYALLVAGLNYTALALRLYY
jgi:hypothetical protein